jgi:osmotically-inducible protein OsmY
MNRRDLYIVIAVVMLLAACAGNINPSRQLDDAALAASVRQALQNDAALRPYTIYVSVDQGVVTLTGSVHTAELRDRAGSVAQSVPNVVRVENRMTVQ